MNTLLASVRIPDGGSTIALLAIAVVALLVIRSRATAS
jgi:protein with PEP-CTERM/exosortase system signal